MCPITREEALLIRMSFHRITETHLRGPKKGGGWYTKLGSDFEPVPQHKYLHCFWLTRPTSVGPSRSGNQIE